MWRAVFTDWYTVTLPDLSQYFHIDADDDTILESRSWRWLRGHILGLLSITDSRLWGALQQAR